METLTLEQETFIYNKRRNLINKANEHAFFIIFGNLKLPAKLSGSKLEKPIAISGNYMVQTTWKLAKRIANGEVITIEK